jgi:tellurite resistance-related uncharacterized protein
MKQIQSILLSLAYTSAMLGGTTHGFIASQKIPMHQLLSTRNLCSSSTTALGDINTSPYRKRTSLFLASSDDNSSGGNERQANGMPILPSSVVKYSTVPRDKYFTIDTIPAGLLKEHSTKEGTWGVIRVHQGKLEYTILEPELSVHILDAESDSIAIIEPTMLHQTKGLTNDLKFVVEFYRVPGTGAVDEKREGL